MEKLLTYFPFLASNRFWAIVLTAVAYYLREAGFELDSIVLSESIMLITGGHITVRSLDRATETLAGVK